MAKLSPKAAAAKKKRDLAFAKTPRRTKMRAENQRLRRAAKKRGANLDGKDYDHNRKKFVSVKTNRSKTKTTNNTMAKKKGVKSPPKSPNKTGGMKNAMGRMKKLQDKMKKSPMKRKAKPVGKAKLQPVKKATAKKTAKKTSVFKRKR